MGRSLIWTLGCILFNAVLIKPTKGDHVTLKIPEQTVYFGDKVYLTCRYEAPGRWKLSKNGHLLHEARDRQQSNFGHYLEINELTTSDDFYSCWIEEKGQSAAKKLTITAKRREIHLKASENVIPEKGFVTLTCDIEGFTGTTTTYRYYRWSRRTASQEERLEISSQTVSISKGGDYTCHWHGNHILTETSNAVTISESEKSSSFSAMFFERLIGGIVLVLLLLLILFLVTKDRCCCRCSCTTTQETNQRAAAHHMDNDDDKQDYVNIFPDYVGRRERIPRGNPR